MNKGLKDGFLKFADLSVGQCTEKEVTWSSIERAIFSDLFADKAPVHFEPEFAARLGYKQPILFGLLLVSGFSGLLGEVLPGALSVIHNVRFDFVSPGFLDIPLVYRLEIVRLSPATKAVILRAEIKDSNGKIYVRGQIQCGLTE